MKRLLLGIFVVLGGIASAQTTKPAKSDAQIKQEIIAQSIASYSGSCPCPYNRDRVGRSCGKRSAYSRPGGAAPLCFEGDVSQKTVDSYRVAKGEKRAPVASASESGRGTSSRKK